MTNEYRQGSATKPITNCGDICLQVKSTLEYLESPYSNEKMVDDNHLEKTEPHFIIHENLALYSYEFLPPTNGSLVRKTLCHTDTFCCTVDYTILTNETPHYALFAYNGTVDKGSGVYTMFTQNCAVIYCTNLTSFESCANINSPHENLLTSFRLKELRGVFDTKFVYPSIFNLDFKLADVNSWRKDLVVADDNKYNVSLNVLLDIDNILSASLFGRYYELDP